MPRCRTLIWAAIGALIVLPVGPITSAEAAVKCPLKLGSIRPESGSAASNGNSLINGMALALEEINAKGGIAGCQVQIVSYDSQSVPVNAATLTRRLVSQDGVPFVIGAPMSVESLAMMEVTENAGIPLYVPSAASAKITNQGFKWVWRQSVIDSLSAEALVTYVTRDLGWKKVAIAYENSDLARPTFQNTLGPKLVAAGATVVAAEAIGSGDSDVSGQLLRIRDTKPDGIVFWGYLKEGALLARQNQQLKLNLPIAGGTGVVYPEFLNILPADVQAATTLYAVTQFVWTTDDPKQKAWIATYKGKYNKEADVTAIDSYDAMFVLKKAIEAAGSMDPEALQSALKKVSYEGVGGQISFDETGQARRDMTIVQLTPKDGPGYRIVKTISASPK